MIARLRALIAGREEEAKRAFIDVDVDGSGRANLDELERALAAVDVPVVAQEVVTVVRRLDERGDGRIRIEAFFEALGVTF